MAHGAAAGGRRGARGGPAADDLRRAVSRAVAAANTRLLTSRKGRDLALLSGLIVAVGAQLVNLGLSSLSSNHGLHRVTSVTSVLRWVPPASAVDAVRSVSARPYGPAAAQLLVGVAVLALVLRWWHRSLYRLMMSPDASTIQPAPDSAALKSGARPPLLTRLLPGFALSRAGTVMERQFRYVARDPRQRASWATGLAVGLLLPLVAVVQHGSVYQCLWTAGLLGMQMYNQFGMDGSAFWTVAATIATRRDAELELRGRALMLGAVALPYVSGRHRRLRAAAREDGRAARGPRHGLRFPRRADIHRRLRQRALPVRGLAGQPVRQRGARQRHAWWCSTSSAAP